MIPKIIHYCWFGGKPLPKEVKKCIKSWEKFAPDYKIKEWNEWNFNISCHPFIESAYNKKAWAFVSDYARLKIIYDYGGIYFDTDVELKKNPDFLLNNKCYIGVQQYGRLCTTGLGFGAIKSNPVVLSMLKKYDGLLFENDIKEKIACPMLNNDAVIEYGYQYSEKIWYGQDITVYPCQYFDPISPGDTKNLLCKDTVSIHHYSATWMDEKNRLRRKLINIISNKKIDRFKKLKKIFARR